MSGKRIGAPTKLTPALQRDFMRVIRRSGFLRDACAVVGITEETLSRWRHWGAAGKEPYRGFCEALKRAEVDRRQEYLRESERRGKKRNESRRRKACPGCGKSASCCAAISPSPAPTRTIPSSSLCSR